MTEILSDNLLFPHFVSLHNKQIVRFTIIMAKMRVGLWKTTPLKRTIFRYSQSFPQYQQDLWIYIMYYGGLLISVDFSDIDEKYYIRCRGMKGCCVSKRCISTELSDKMTGGSITPGDFREMGKICVVSAVDFPIDG